MLQDQHRDRTPLRSDDVLLIAPSRRLDEIAAEHVRSLPRTMRALLGDLGASRPQEQGQALASYLLFEAAFTNELIHLGESDALRKRSDIVRFFGWDRTPGAAPLNPAAQAQAAR
jgi:NTE family protein